MKKDASGPAFSYLTVDPWHKSHVHPGMTKREYFAANAMQAILSNPYVNQQTGPMCEAGNDYIAKWAINQADALLKELEK